MLQSYEGEMAIKKEPHFVKLYKRRLQNPQKYQRMHEDTEIQKMILEQAKQKKMFEHVSSVKMFKSFKTSESNETKTDAAQPTQTNSRVM